MDALRSAKETLDSAQNIRDSDTWRGDRTEITMYKVAAAQAYAAIALAEQLKCIADALQQIAVTLDTGTSPTMGRIPAALRGPHVDEDLPL